MSSFINKCRVPFFLALYAVIFVILGMLGYYTAARVDSVGRILHRQQNTSVDVIRYTLPRLSVGLSTGNQSTHVQIDIELEIAQQDTDILQGYEPRMMDRLNRFFANIQPEQIEPKLALPWLRAEILRQVNSVGAPAPVRAIYLKRLDIITGSFLIPSHESDYARLLTEGSA